MLQVSQDYASGEVQVLEVPPPALRPKGVRVRTVASLISSGTERSKIELARKGLLAKAKDRPEEVRRVLETIRREGIANTYRRVRNRLDQLSSLGYSAAGVVIDVGEGVTKFRVGDRVAVGGGYANHAEVLWVPENLAVHVPDGVELDAAAFATVGAIALHAVRLGRPGLGDSVGVIGLGLVGQMAAQFAVAAGCTVIACDPEEARLALAEARGATAVTPREFARAIQAGSGGIGADVVLVTAATKSSEPLNMAADVSRNRGTVVAVGAVGMDISREPFYRKELRFVVSRSYGPGRYDPTYEEEGHDYPVGYVRWTEGRNLGAVLHLIREGRIGVRDLISKRFPIERAVDAYDSLTDGGPEIVGVVLDYPSREGTSAPTAHPAKPALRRSPRRASAPLGVGLIGAGSFASNVLIPALKATGKVRLCAVASASGLSARDAVRRHGFSRCVAAPDEIFASEDVDLVLVATPHDLHADLVLGAARAGKPVFVEKPLAIDRAQLDRLAAELPADAQVLVGLNRRFSPHVRALEGITRARSGAAIVSIRVNAGSIPRESWIHDPAVGGGRLVGEGCHFVDLCIALVGSVPTAVHTVGVSSPDPDASLMDNFAITLEFRDGSIGTVLYTSRGDPMSGKERVEVFCDGRSGVIDNFDRSSVFRDGARSRLRLRAGKGHREEIAALVGSVVDGTPMPVGLDELLMSTAATLAARESLIADGERVTIA